MKQRFFKIMTIAAGIVMASCSDFDGINTENQTGKGIRFITDISQDWKAEKENTRKKMRKQPIHAVPIQSSDGTQLWLKGVTTNGIRNAKQEMEAENNTRGQTIEEVANMSDFSSFSYKTDNSVLYTNIKSTAKGILEKEYAWPEGTQLKFFAVYPYDIRTTNFGVDLSTGLTYNFTVNANVTEQKDLMYAVTGILDYNENQTAPLHFVHALTAIDFVMGNFAFEGYVKKITLKNVYTSGTLTLPTEKTTYSGETGEATWSNLGNRKDIVIDGLNANIQEGNVKITSSENNTTLLMIPQRLEGVEVEIIIDVNGHILTVSGSLADTDPEASAWVAGTTRTYTFNSTKDISGFTLTLNTPESLSQLNYNAASLLFGIDSYELYGDGSREEVEWEVADIVYSTGEGDGSGWVEITPSGSGGSSENVSLEIAQEPLVDKLAARNAALKAATVRGSAAEPYDLSTHGINGEPTAMNTANCYIISAPGFYKLPLVHGNAIKGGFDNPSSYTSTSTSADSHLASFQNYRRIDDYTSEDITSPWLRVNGGNKEPVKALIVWSDIVDKVIDNTSEYEGETYEDFHYEPFILKGTTITEPTIDGDYLKFEVTQEKIEQGNVVVAVKDDSDVIMWSWHLWFTTPDALQTKTFTNYNDYQSKIAAENLGQKYSKWLASPYERPRTATVTIRQKRAPAGEEPKTASFTIVQSSGIEAFSESLMYQFGRKDAFPGLDVIRIPKYYNNEVNPTVRTATSSVAIHQSIQSPLTLYGTGGSNWSFRMYRNLWAANAWGISDDVVKTIYDPCPVGFHVPRGDFLDGIIRNKPSNTLAENYASQISDRYRLNVKQPGRLYRGYGYLGMYIYTNCSQSASEKDSKMSETVYFPTTGSRYLLSTNLQTESVANSACYWTASPTSSSNGKHMYFSTSTSSDYYDSYWIVSTRARQTYTYNFDQRSSLVDAKAVRPVAD